MTNELALDRQVCFALYSASRATTAVYRPMLERLGVTYPQYLVLLVLWEKDGRGVREIGAELELGHAGRGRPRGEGVQHVIADVEALDVPRVAAECYTLKTTPCPLTNLTPTPSSRPAGSSSPPSSPRKSRASSTKRN